MKSIPHYYDAKNKIATYYNEKGKIIKTKSYRYDRT